MEDTTIETALKTFQDYYLKQDFHKALQVLQQHGKDIEPAIWNYNLGLVHAELKNYPLARYHLMKAQDLGASLPELAQSQALVDEQLDVIKLEKPINASDRFIKAGLTFTDGPFVTLSLIMLITGLWSLKKTLSFKRAGLVLLSVALPLVLNLWVNSWPRRIVPEARPLMDGPSALFTSRGELPAGVLIVTNRKGDWEEVVYPARFQGWIKSEGLLSLEKK